MQIETFFVFQAALCFAQSSFWTTFETYRTHTCKKINMGSNQR
jgi:hypothetical protein